MGFLSDLSGDIFGSAPKTSAPAPTSTLTPEQSNALNSLLSQLQGQGGIYKSPTPYQGQLTTDLSQLQQTSLAGLEQQALALAQPGGTPLQSSAQSSLMSLMSPDATSTGPGSTFDKFFKSSVQDPLMQAFNEQIAPQLLKQFASPSQVSSSDKNAAVGFAGQNLTTELSRDRSNLAFQTEQAGLTRQLGAAQASSAVGNAPIQQLTSTLAGGGVPTALNQQNIQAQYSDYQTQLANMQKQIENLLASIRTPAVENIVTQTGGQAGLLGGLSQGVGTGLGAGLAKYILAP